VRRPTASAAATKPQTASPAAANSHQPKKRPAIFVGRPFYAHDVFGYRLFRTDL
jgi:hypothetical protein